MLIHKLTWTGGLGSKNLEKLTWNLDSERLLQVNEQERLSEARLTNGSQINNHDRTAKVYFQGHVANTLSGGQGALSQALSA